MWFKLRIFFEKRHCNRRKWMKLANDCINCWTLVQSKCFCYQYQRIIYLVNCTIYCYRPPCRPTHTGHWNFFWKEKFVTSCHVAFRVNLLKPTGHVMHQQFNIQQLYVLPTLYLCVLYLSENKQRLVTQHKLIGFYNRDEKCLLRGTNWVFK